MIALARFVARRILRRIGSRSRLLSRALVVLGIVRWWNGRPRGRQFVTIARGETLVVGVEKNGDHGHV